MSDIIASVKLWNKNVGALVWSDQDQVATFEYEPRFYENNWNIAPILMPVSNTRQRIYSFQGNKTSTFKGLPGLLADMLPDKYGNAIINSWLVNQGRPANSLNPIELLCFIGKRGMGALEIEPALRSDIDKASKIELDQIIDISNQILSHKENVNVQLSDKNNNITDIIRVGTSAGGARAKAIIAFNEKTNEIRSGQVKAPKNFGYWIIKFDGVTDSQTGESDGYGRVEMAYHLMAKAAGIEMTTSRLYEENNRAHFMTKRFDRESSGAKLHMQSFCAMRHFDFNMVGYYSYEQLFETMRMLTLPYYAAEQLFTRMVFNVLSRNCDDHTKNFAFIMDTAGSWSLSPAYDVCHAYRPGSDWVNSQSLSVNGKRINITEDDFISVAKQMNIKKASLIIDKVKYAVIKWPEFAEEVKVNAKLRDGIKRTLLV